MFWLVFTWEGKSHKGLLSFLGYDITGNIEEDIKVIGIKVFKLLNLQNFHDIRPIDNGKKLNDSGIALAADFGILLANFLKKNIQI